MQISKQKSKQKHKNKKVTKGSLTIEAAYIVPGILFIVVIIIYIIFYYYDKNILNGIAYEAAVVGSQSIRNQSDVGSARLINEIQGQTDKRLILLRQVYPVVEIQKERIVVRINAGFKYMKVSVQQQAAILEPETYIRNLQRLK